MRRMDIDRKPLKLTGALSDMKGRVHRAMKGIKRGVSPQGDQGRMPEEVTAELGLGAESGRPGLDVWAGLQRRRVSVYQKAGPLGPKPRQPRAVRGKAMGWQVGPC